MSLHPSDTPHGNDKSVPEDYSIPDSVFCYQKIYKSSDNRRLNQVLNNLREQIYRYRVEYLKDEETRNLLVKEHEEIYEAIRNRDVKQAQEISYQHIENQREAIIRSIREETQNRQVHK